ncbi:MAG: DUF418 domain-containing protein [Firmicutes bacterium]|nr:DUF418 domain-containing protein [Dethiobacter sp.]MBS3888475.1 DUF418 domain-containing protein [Bacillota bacterium]
MVGPVAVKERIAVLDIIRGFALLGVLLVNMVMINQLLMEFNTDMDVLFQPALLVAGPASITAWIVQVLFLGKFYTIFAFLFGLGFHLFLSRGEGQTATNRRLLVSRLAVLFGIGVLHIIFVWWGDVLASYALIGFLLLLFRETKLPRLRAWAVGLMLLSFVIVAGSIYLIFALPTFANATLDGLAPADVAAMEAAFEARLNEIRTVYTQGSYWQVVSYRLRNEFPLVLINAIVMIPRILGLFLIGLYVGKLGVFQRIKEHLPQIRKAMYVGGVVGAVLSVAHVGLQLGWAEAFLTPVLSGTAAVFLREVSTPFISLFYVTGIILLWHRGALSWLFAGFAALGRMALTNYLVQCIALAWLFYGHGLGLMGISIVYMPLMTIGIYTSQIIYSRWWLARYSQGPAEWVWRRLTYGPQGVRSEQTSAGV